jgi:hypothetical protein
MLDFPNSPTIGQTFPSPSIAGVPIWRWDGNEWAPGSATAIGAVEGNYSLAASAASGALTITLNDMFGNPLSGSSAVLFYFTSAGGILTPITISSPQTLVIPSGATLGQPSAAAFRIWIVGINDGGTFRLGAICCSDATKQIYSLQEHLPINATLISAPATSAGVIYANATVGAKFFRILGFLEWSSAGVATAGTWTVTSLLYSQRFGAGIRKPGFQVNGQFSSVTGRSAAVTAASYTNTSHTATYTPTSAANIVKVTVETGIMGGLGSATSIDVFGRLVSGSTQIGMEHEIINGNASQISSSTTIVAYDKPNTLSAQTYTMQCYAKASGNSAWIGGTSLANPSTQFLFEELVT